jgi:hypothetical protein
VVRPGAVAALGIGRREITSRRLVRRKARVHLARTWLGMSASRRVIACLNR